MAGPITIDQIRCLIRRVNTLTSSSAIERDGDRWVRMHTLERHVFDELLDLAKTHWQLIIHLFSEIEDSRVRISVCEALASTREKALGPFFIELWLGADEDLRDIASIALAGLGQREFVEQIFFSAEQTLITRHRYHRALALISLKDKRGIDLFVWILTKEKSYVEFHNGRVTSPSGIEVFSVLINSLMHELFPNQSHRTPFEWIPWWECSKQSIGELTLTETVQRRLRYVPKVPS